MLSPADRAQKLRAEGLTYAKIAGQLNVSKSTVYRWLNPQSRERQLVASRAWKAANTAHARTYSITYHEQHRAACERCDKPMGLGSKPGVCMSCRHATRHARALWIEHQWAAGRPLAEIARELNWSFNHLAGEFGRLRAEGYNLPHRYRVQNGKRIGGPA